MKFLLYPIFFLLILQAAEVDKRFFTNDTKKIFLEEAQQRISENPNKDLALLESALLSKIEQTNAKDFTTTFEKMTFEDNVSIDISIIEQSINQIIAAKKEQTASKNKILQIVSKLDYTKMQIEDITSESKDNLLSLQLQYSLYQVMLNKKKARVVLLDEYITQSTSQLQNVIVRLDTKSYENMIKALNATKTTINDLEEKKVALGIKIGREILLEGENVDKLTLKKEEAHKKLDTYYLDALRMTLNLCLVEIVHDKQEAFHKSLKTSDSYMELISPKSLDGEQDYYQLVKEFGKAHFGVVSTAMSASKESLTDSLSYLWNLLFEPLFVLNEKAISSADILKILVILISGFFIAGLYRRRILNWSERWVTATPMTAKLTANLGYYFIGFITFIIGLSSIGLNLTSFSMFASALAIGIGFGLQTVVSNMVAGIIMMFERSIRVGDVIEISDILRGTVTDMRIRSTVIKTFDNIDVVVPNSSFVQNNVINLTFDDKTRRLHVPFGVAYGTEVETVQQAILNELKQSKLNYHKSKYKEPLVRMLAMGTSSVDYELLVWVELGSKKTPDALASDFLILIYKTLYKYNIEIPFPQLDLHVKDSTLKPV